MFAQQMRQFIKAAAPAGLTTYLFDTFTAADWTALGAGYVPDVCLFAGPYVGNGTIMSNRGGGNTVNTPRMPVMDTGSSAITFQSSGDAISNAYAAGLACRCGAAYTASWLFVMDRPAAADTYARIFENRTIQRASQLMGTMAAAALKVTWVGDVGTLIFDGVPTVSYTCPTKGNYWGIFAAYNYNTTQVDNFKLER